MKPIFKHLFFAIVYMIAHSGLLVVHLTVLHVAMNEDNLGFLSVITLIQFNELKSAVMKDISYKKLEAMCHDGIVTCHQLPINNRHSRNVPSPLSMCHAFLF